jgi:hypothetical protein
MNQQSPEPQKRAAEEAQMLDRLAQIWQTCRKRDLESRRQMGELLNEQLGPPTQSQDYGAGTLKKASKRLRISESELSRMRWFAYHFASLAALKKARRDADTWSKVKTELARRNPKGGQRTGGSRPAEDQAPSVGRLVRSLGSAVAQLTRLVSELAEQDEAAVLEAFRQLQEAAQARFPQLFEPSCVSEAACSHSGTG